MYKKISLFFLLFLIVGCSKETKTSQSTSNNNSNTEQSSQIESIEEIKSTAKDIKGAPFQEEIPENSPYPIAQLDEGVSISELRQAYTQYYKENYQGKDKEINLDEIVPRELERLQRSFDEDDRFKALDISVEQVTMTIDTDQVHVARVIVPMTYKEAESELKNNDIAILNETLSNIGDRLVMIAYYDESTNTLTPMHLTNSLKPLFYNQYLTE